MSDEHSGMADWLRGLVTFAICTTHGFVTGFLVSLAFDDPELRVMLLLAGGGFGVLYGMEASAVGAYDLSKGIGWLELFVDMTWSLPNTIWGLVIGNILFIFFGYPSREMSDRHGFIAFKPWSSSTTFGNKVLQTHGTVNLGGAGNHELVHVMQARIFGPLYLPIFAVNYVINGLIQGLWMVPLGLTLWLTKVRKKPYFCPPDGSAVGGFFGWIYYYTMFEYWAYKTE